MDPIPGIPDWLGWAMVGMATAVLLALAMRVTTRWDGVRERRPHSYVLIGLKLMQAALFLAAGVAAGLQMRRPYHLAMALFFSVSVIFLLLWWRGRSRMHRHPG